MAQNGGVRTRIRFANLLLILSIFVSLFSAVIVARHLGLSYADPSARMRYHAIPVAISQIYHGRIHDYTAHWSVAMKFHNETPLATAIQQAIGEAPSPDEKTYYWTADDRGLSDFVNLGFRLLGPSMPALFYFWFLLFGLSVFLGTVRFWRDPTALTVIACAVVSVGAALPALTRAASASFSEASIHLTESRMFDLLASVAAIHLVLLMFRPPSMPRWLDIGSMLLQVGLIAAYVHVRASVAYLFVAIIALALFVTAMEWRSRARLKAASLRIIAAVGIAWAGVSFYQNLMFNSAYQAEIGPRTFWHNILMGMGSNAKLKDILKIDVNDRTAVDAVLTDMKQRNDPRLSAQWETQNILNSLGSHSTFDWRTYEQVARDLVVRTIAAEPLAALTLFAWNKPTGIVHTISCNYLVIKSACSATGTSLSPQQRQATFWWLWLSLFLLIALCLLLARHLERGFPRSGDPDDVRGIPLALLFMSLVGFAPSIVIYTGVTQLGGAFVFALTAIAFWLIVVALRTISHIFATRSALSVP